tara:strand:- start:2858 stop:3508 length:651 start_codon:yes stop_codon:yes gene_type:complete
MQYNKITSDSDINLVLEFCDNYKDSLDAVSKNMEVDDWENKPGTLLHAIYKEKRYDVPKSGYFIITSNDKPIIGMGYDPTEFDENVCAISRMYAPVGNENQLGKHSTHDVFYYLLNLAEKDGYAGFIMTFNEYNLFLLEKTDRFNRPEKHKNYAWTAVNNGDTWIHYHFREPGIRITPYKRVGPCNIRNTNQAVLYHLWDGKHEKNFLEKIGHLCV